MQQYKSDIGQVRAHNYFFQLELDRWQIYILRLIFIPPVEGHRSGPKLEL